MAPERAMRIGKPLLITTTAIGLPLGIYEGFHLARGFGVVLVVLMGLFGFGIYWTFSSARAEERAQREKDATRPP
jgi:hypothetical protein